MLYMRSSARGSTIRGSIQKLHTGLHEGGSLTVLLGLKLGRALMKVRRMCFFVRGLGGRPG